MTKSTANKKTKAMKKRLDKKIDTDKLDEIQQEKHIEEEAKLEKPVENGIGITIVLSGDLLLGGLLYKQQIPYKVNKETFLLLEHHCNVLGIAMRMA